MIEGRCTYRVGAAPRQRRRVDAERAKALVLGLAALLCGVLAARDPAPALTPPVPSGCLTCPWQAAGRAGTFIPLALPAR